MKLADICLMQTGDQIKKQQLTWLEKVYEFLILKESLFRDLE